MTSLRNRPTGELLVLAIAGTVCGVVAVLTVVVAVSELLHPDVDTSLAVGQVSDIVNTLVGLLAGFLAGRSEGMIRRRNGNGDAERDHPS